MMKYLVEHVLKQKAAGREHIYILTGTCQTVNRHGFAADVLVWAGSCSACGCPFEAAGSRNGHRHLTRNCTAHRRKTASKQRKTPNGFSVPRHAGEVREKCAACLREPSPVTRPAVAREVRGTCGWAPSIIPW
jgi:hypothetical protein